MFYIYIEITKAIFPVSWQKEFLCQSYLFHRNCCSQSINKCKRNSNQNFADTSSTSHKFHKTLANYHIDAHHPKNNTNSSHAMWIRQELVRNQAKNLYNTNLVCSEKESNVILEEQARISKTDWKVSISIFL